MDCRGHIIPWCISLNWTWQPSHLSLPLKSTWSKSNNLWQTASPVVQKYPNRAAPYRFCMLLSYPTGSTSLTFTACLIRYDYHEVQPGSPHDRTDNYLTISSVISPSNRNYSLGRSAYRMSNRPAQRQKRGFFIGDAAITSGHMFCYRIARWCIDYILGTTGLERNTFF